MVRKTARVKKKSTIKRSIQKQQEMRNMKVMKVTKIKGEKRIVSFIEIPTMQVGLNSDEGVPSFCLEALSLKHHQPQKALKPLCPVSWISSKTIKRLNEARSARVWAYIACKRSFYGVLTGSAIELKDVLFQAPHPIMTKKSGRFCIILAGHYKRIRSIMADEPEQMSEDERAMMEQWEGMADGVMPKKATLTKP